jgi:hypothetical protein
MVVKARSAWLAVVLAFIVSGCAVREVTTPSATPTTLPGLVILPPPAQTFTGECTLDSRNWEFWLQAAAFQIEGFRVTFEQALTAEAERRPVLAYELAAVRDAAYRNPTPECAVPTQFLLTAAMDRAVEALRSASLDPNVNLAASGGEINAMLVQAHDALKAMTDELEQALVAREAASD